MTRIIKGFAVDWGDRWRRTVWAQLDHIYWFNVSPDRQVEFDRGSSPMALNEGDRGRWLGEQPELGLRSRMEPEHPAVRLKGHSAQAPEWPFAISRSVSARRKRAVIEIARRKTRSRGAAYRPCTERLIESPVARTP